MRWNRNCERGAGEGTFVMSATGIGFGAGVFTEFRRMKKRPQRETLASGSRFNAVKERRFFIQ